MFGRKHLSSDWRRVGDLQLELNFDRSSLNGVGIGEAVDGLSGLGPSDDAGAARDGVLRYLSHGLELRASDGRLEEITLIWVDTLKDGYSPFSGVCRWKGRTLNFGPATVERDITFALGNADGREETRDEESGTLEEVVLTYSASDIEWEVTLGPRGALQEIRLALASASEGP